MKKKQEEPTEQSSNSSTSRIQPTAELYSPERKRAPNREVPEESGKVIDENDEDKWPVFEDCHLKDLIDLRIKQIQLEREKNLHQLMKWKRERSR